VVFIFNLFLSFTLFATSYTEVKNIVVTSDKIEQYDIKQDLNNKAIVKAAEIEIKKILGPKGYRTHKSKIIKNVYPQSKKYISSLTPLKLNVEPPNSTATYSVRLSQESLMQLLKTNGMFYSNSAEMKILPLVVYKDNVDFKNYFWWGGNSPFVSKRGKSFLKNFHKKLTANLKENKFSVIEPIRKKYFKKIPVEQQFLKLSPSDVKAIAKAIGANMVILGEITVGKGMKVDETYTVGYNIRAVQVEGMKTISTAKEVFTSLPGSFRSSVPQLVKRSHQNIIAKLGSGFKNIWNEGQMGAKIYTITLKGDLKYKQYKSFKKDLITNIGAVNSINEKNFSPGTIVLELNSPASLKNVAERLKKSKFRKYKVNVSQDSKSSLELDIQSW